MPAERTPRSLRRSRRISQLPPRCNPEDIWESYEGLLSADSSATERSPSEDSNVSLPSPSPSSSPIPAPPSPLPVSSSHTRKHVPGHVPRPPNAFIMFRSEVWRTTKAARGKTDHRVLSCDVAAMWHKLSEEDKIPYRIQAQQAKERHLQLYPGYKYTPIYRKDKPARRKVRKDVETRPLHRASKATHAKASSSKYKPRQPRAEPSIKQEPVEATVPNSPSAPFAFSGSPSADSISGMEDNFVGLDEIPDLDLNAMSITDYKCESPAATWLQPPQHDLSRLDVTFGVQPDLTLTYEVCAGDNYSNHSNSGSPSSIISPLSPIHPSDFTDPWHPSNNKGGFASPLPISPKTLPFDASIPYYADSSIAIAGPYAPAYHYPDSEFDEWINFNEASP